jgi:hypothetical protein
MHLNKSADMLENVGNFSEGEKCNRCNHELGISAPYTVFGKCQCGCHVGKT